MYINRYTYMQIHIARSIHVQFYAHTQAHVSVEKLQRSSVGWPALQVPLEHERFHVSKVQTHPTPSCGHWPLANKWFLSMCSKLKFTVLVIKPRLLSIIGVYYQCNTINNQKLISTTNNPTTNGCHYVQNTITYHQLVDNITISNYLLWEEEPRGLAGKTGSVRDHIILPSCIYHHNQDSGLAYMHSVAYMHTYMNVYHHNQDTAATYMCAAANHYTKQHSSVECWVDIP